MLDSILGGVGALASSIFGAVSSSNANKKALKMLDQQAKDNKHWWQVKRSEDYTLRPDAQAAFNRQREILDEQYNKARGLNVVAGASDESVAMQKEAANKAVADAAATVAAAGAEAKDKAEQQYLSEKQRIENNKIAMKQQQAANTAAAAGQAVSAGLNVLGNAAGTPKTETKVADSVAKATVEANNTKAVNDAMKAAEAQASVKAQQDNLNKTIKSTVPTPAAPIMSQAEMDAARKVKKVTV